MSWTFDTPSSCRLWDHLKTNHMQLICCLHAARNAERGGDSRQDADGYLNHHFPGFLFHHLLLLKGSTIFVWG